LPSSAGSSTPLIDPFVRPHQGLGVRHSRGVTREDVNVRAVGEQPGISSLTLFSE
jgi:hypothetical protein